MRESLLRCPIRGAFAAPPFRQLPLCRPLVFAHAADDIADLFGFFIICCLKRCAQSLAGLREKTGAPL